MPRCETSRCFSVQGWRRAGILDEELKLLAAEGAGSILAVVGVWHRVVLVVRPHAEDGHVGSRQAEKGKVYPCVIQRSKRTACACAEEHRP